MGTGDVEAPRRGDLDPGLPVLGRIDKSYPHRHLRHVLYKHSTGPLSAVQHICHCTVESMHEIGAGIIDISFSLESTGQL